MAFRLCSAGPVLDIVNWGGGVTLSVTRHHPLESKQALFNGRVLLLRNLIILVSFHQNKLNEFQSREVA